MNAERYRLLVDVFERARELPLDERTGFLERACEDDSELLAEARAMLERDADDDRVFDGAAGEVADLLADEEEGELAPERIASYRIERRLGEGGMGVVFEAEQENPRRRVALKVVRPGLWTRGARRRFELEAEVLGRLEHPGIARIFEAGTAETEWGELPFFAMELVRGVPVTQWADENGLGVRARVELVRSICAAVQHAHERGVVHRDLKPANVLVQDGQPVVLDFGVARLCDDGAPDSSLTRSGQVIGTLAYMSPEQARGDADAIDGRADVYSLGVIAYELVTGRLPYDVRGASLAEMARAVEERDPAPLDGVETRFRSDLETILARALAKEPARRYASAASLGQDLARFLADEPILARPPTRLYQLRKFTRRNPWLVGGMASTFLALVLGLAGTLRFARAAQAREAEAQDALASATRVQELFLDTLDRADPYDRRGADLTVVELFESAAVQAPAGIEEEPRTEASYRRLIGRILFDFHRDDLAREQLERVVALETELYGRDHPSTLDARGLLGRAVANTGDFDRALEIHEELLADMRRVGNDPVRTWGQVHYVAELLRFDGQLERSLELEQEALRELEELEPGGHDTVWAAIGVARTLNLLKRGEEGVEPLERALAAARERLGPDHRTVILATETLAATYVEAGRAADSLELCEELIERFTRLHGAESPEVLRTRSSRAMALGVLGRHEEAAAAYEAVVAVQERTLGRLHDDTVTSLYNLGEEYLALGWDERALQLSEDLVARVEQTFDRDHYFVAACHIQLAGAFARHDWHDDALELLEPALETLRDGIGLDHPLTDLCLDQLIASGEAAGRADDVGVWRELRGTD